MHQPPGQHQASIDIDHGLGHGSSQTLELGTEAGLLAGQGPVLDTWDVQLALVVEQQFGLLQQQLLG